jgi:hypothetical protein
MNAKDPSGSQLTDIDRRRPGRVQNVSPELIPLLRNTLPEVPDASPLLFDVFGVETEADRSVQIGGNPLGAATGILLALALSVPLWLVVIAACYVVF